MQHDGICWNSNFSLQKNNFRWKWKSRFRNMFGSIRSGTNYSQITCKLLTMHNIWALLNSLFMVLRVHARDIRLAPHWCAFEPSALPEPVRYLWLPIGAIPGVDVDGGCVEQTPTPRGSHQRAEREPAGKGMFRGKLDLCYHGTLKSCAWPSAAPCCSVASASRTCLRDGKKQNTDLFMHGFIWYYKYFAAEQW